MKTGSYIALKSYLQDKEARALVKEFAEDNGFTLKWKKFTGKRESYFKGVALTKGKYRYSLSLIVASKSLRIHDNTKHKVITFPNVKKKIRRMLSDKAWDITANLFDILL